MQKYLDKIAFYQTINQRCPLKSHTMEREDGSSSVPRLEGKNLPCPCDMSNEEGGMVSWGGKGVPGAAAKPQSNIQQFSAHHAALTSPQADQHFNQTFALAPDAWHEGLPMKSKHWLLLTQGNSRRGGKMTWRMQVGEEGVEKSRRE